MAGRRGRTVLVALLVVTLLGVYHYRRTRPGAEPGSAAVLRPELRRWDLPGCYALRVEPWIPAPPSAPAPLEPEPLLVAPTRVLLLADSSDATGRAYTTYRALPIAGEHDRRLERYLRWFVAADTLWLVWSDGFWRAGIALLADEDGFVGRGRAIGPDGSWDGGTWAAAWRIDCATGERRAARSGPRR